MQITPIKIPSFAEEEPAADPSLAYVGGQLPPQQPPPVQETDNTQQQKTPLPSESQLIMPNFNICMQLLTIVSA